MQIFVIVFFSMSVSLAAYIVERFSVIPNTAFFIIHLECRNHSFLLEEHRIYLKFREIGV